MERISELGVIRVYTLKEGSFCFGNKGFISFALVEFRMVNYVFA